VAEPRRTKTRRAILSYSQLKEFTDWPDLLLKDYQGILQDFGFTADEIDDLEIATEAAIDSALQSAIDEAFFYSSDEPNIPKWRAVIANSNYDAVASDYVEARTGLVNLPQFPSENDEVIVASDFSGNVVISGNGNNIKRKEETRQLIISQVGTSLHFLYFIGGGYWRVI